MTDNDRLTAEQRARNRRLGLIMAAIALAIFLAMILSRGRLLI